MIHEDYPVLLDGYPDFGSPSNAMVDWLVTKSTDGQISRMHGSLNCMICKDRYDAHTMADAPDYLDWMGRPYLHVLCDGRLVLVESRDASGATDTTER